jgi:hypothetical protein
MKTETPEEKLACGHTRSQHRSNGGTVVCAVDASQELFGSTYKLIRQQSRADDKVEAKLEELRGPSVSMDLAAANRLSAQLAHANGRRAPEPVPFDRPEFAGKQNVATICGWCLVPDGRLTILKLQRRPTDVVGIIVQGHGPTSISIFRNGERLQVSHGICPGCRSKTLVEHQAAAAPAETVQP